MYHAIDRGRAKPVFVPIPKKNRVWPKPNLNFGLDTVEPTCGSRQPRGDSGVGAEGLKLAPIAAWAANIANGMRVEG